MGENLRVSSAGVKDAAVEIVRDELLLTSVDQVRAAALEVGGSEFVGAHVSAEMEAEGLALHLLECTNPAYVGWVWAVTAARAPGDDSPTICDVVLLPGDGALLAPEWVPWSERVRPGDLGVGDVLPTRADDPRLVAGFTGEGDLETAVGDEPLAVARWELGFGRERVLSAYGRDVAADRWDAGDFGPHAEMAQAAAMKCASCGFLVALGGVMGQAFGICANDMAPADGRLVSLNYGCGAHSQVAIEVVPTTLTEREEDVAVELGHS